MQPLSAAIFFREAFQPSRQIYAGSYNDKLSDSLD